VSFKIMLMTLIMVTPFEEFVAITTTVGTKSVSMLGPTYEYRTVIVSRGSWH